MNIVVCGASSGIGFDLVKKFFTENGNNIIAIARTRQKLDQLEKDCIRASGTSTLTTLVMDIAGFDYSELVRIIEQKFGHLDLLVNNAGYMLNQEFERIGADDLMRSYRVNIIGPFLLTQQVIPFLKQSKAGQIINIGSMGGITGTVKFKGLTAYSSSKGALSIWTECLAEELKDDGIKVNCLALGAVNTDMLQKAFPGYVASHEPSEMAEFIKDFAMKGSKFFNGKVIPVSSTTP